MVSKNISGLKAGTSNNRAVQSNDVGDIITSEGIVLHLSESCSNPDISSGVRAEIDADLGIVVYKGCNLALVIRESIELQPKGLRVVQWLAFIKGTLVVNTAVRHIVEVYKLMNVRTSNFLSLLWTRKAVLTEVVHEGVLFQESHPALFSEAYCIGLIGGFSSSLNQYCVGEKAYQHTWHGQASS